MEYFFLVHRELTLPIAFRAGFFDAAGDSSNNRVVHQLQVHFLAAESPVVIYAFQMVTPTYNRG